MEVRGICFWHTRDFFKRRLDIEKNLANRPLHVQFVQRTNGKVEVRFTWSLAWENSRHLATLPLVFPPNDDWEKSRHLATLPLVFPPNDVWEMSAKNPILMTRHYPDLGSASDWSCRVGNLIQQSFLRRSSTPGYQTFWRFHPTL